MSMLACQLNELWDSIACSVTYFPFPWASACRHLAYMCELAHLDAGCVKAEDWISHLWLPSVMQSRVKHFEGPPEELRNPLWVCIIPSFRSAFAIGKSINTRLDGPMLVSLFSNVFFCVCGCVCAGNVKKYALWCIAYYYMH